MGRIAKECPVCRHPDRLRVDREVIQGGNFTAIAASIGVTTSHLFRHRKHASEALTRLAADRDTGIATTLVSEMRQVQRQSWTLLHKMSKEGDHRGAVLAVRECREVLESIDGMLTRAAEALNNGGMAIHVVDVGTGSYCPECPHCTRLALPEHVDANQ